MGQTFDTIVEFVSNRVGLFVILAFLLGANYVVYLRSSRYLERAMARKKERETIGQLLSNTLQDAAHRKEITPQQWHKYNKKLGVALGLPDMIPMSATSRLWSGVRPDLNKAKKATIRRLTEMGVNISEGLHRVRSKQTKKDRLLANIKRKS